jgi:hypothetical protein
MDLDVGRLALEAARGLVDHDLALGRQKRLPLAPAASSSEPIEAAMPDAHRRDVGRMYCMVS